MSDLKILVDSVLLSNVKDGIVFVAAVVATVIVFSVIMTRRELKRGSKE